MLTITVFWLLLKEYSCFLILPNDTLEEKSFNGRRPINTGDIPDYFDWREQDAVSPVKNQGHCAACWAFSTAATIESHRKIYLNVKETLSEQFLIDCDPAGNGCNDGSILQTYANMVTIFGGILRDEDYYPFVAEQRECRWNAILNLHATNYTTRSFENIPSPRPQPVPVIGFRRVFRDEDVMTGFLYNYGPLSAAINLESMGRYKGGIDEPTDKNCSPNELNHAVEIVGYNVYVSENGKRLPYWIIKNSWGTEWGDNGYYYLVRGRNACGIASDVSFPFVG
uniref:Peptidase C1A papain C-terminal domain-containing protein n=1 Tax=Heliothis virescens TaxID=7102 RepID=A0A2A4K987_HELVI